MTKKMKLNRQRRKRNLEKETERNKTPKRVVYRLLKESDFTLI